MKRYILAVMALAFFVACNDNKSTKEKYDREKTTREQDDYSKSTTTSPEKKEEKTTTTPVPEERKAEEQTEPSAKDTGHSGWNSSDRNSFLQNCVGTASNKAGPERAREYCECMLKKLESKYATYADANSDLALPGNDAFLQKMIDDCNGKK